MRVLYDGWPLIFQPNSPGALHLLALLSHLPDQVRPLVALPGPAPAWFPERVERLHSPLLDASQRRTGWEQRSLPRIIRQAKNLDLLHLTTPGPALFAPIPAVLSPAGFELPWSAREGRTAGRRTGLLERWRGALGRGGLERLAGVFWPDDLPGPQTARRVMLVPPLPGNLDPAGWGSMFGNRLPASIPESYILYHGPTDEASLDLAAASWSWAAGPVGANTTLLLLGSGGLDGETLSLRMAEHDLQDTVQILPALEPAVVIELYQNCAALFHLGSEPPWGGPVRRALAAGRPVVAAEHPLVEAVVGPAGYLSPPEARSLGAALITVLVEESVSSQLVEAARQRAEGWHTSDFSERLWEAYQAAAA